jgi:tetratricopeptide (TPR) repeat protein
MSLSSNVQQSTASLGRSERLESWKEIASYLRREVRTVQLWEKKEGLPVHRHFHKRLGSVFAFREEIEQWASRASRKGPEVNRRVETAVAAEPEVGARPTIYLIAGDETMEDSDRHQAYALIAQISCALQKLGAGPLSVLQVGLEAARDEEVMPTKLGTLRSADHVLSLNIQRERATAQVVASLSSADNEVVGHYVHTYDPKVSTNGSVEVASQIAQCVWLKLISTPKSAPVVVRGKVSASREAYLKGRFFWNQRSERGMRNAIRCFESSIKEDPQFAPAHSGLADSFSLLAFYEIVSPSEAMPGARQAALKAIELDPDLAEGHASLADIYLHFDRDWQAADCEYRRAIECNPSYALGYHWYANLLSARGQHTAAHMAIMQALEIDPVSLITRVWAGVTSHLAHRFDEAIQYYEGALEMDPHFIWAHMYMAQTLEQLGNYEEAFREFETTIQLTGGNNCVRAMKAHAYALAGNTSSAHRILGELRDSSTDKCLPSYDIAATYAALGESDEMVRWLDRACQEHNMKLFTLIQDPRFDPHRHSPQFKRIVERTGLSQPRTT